MGPCLRRSGGPTRRRAVDDVYRVRAGIVVNVTPGDRRRLEAIVGNRNAPQKHVWRAKIILATADGYGTAEIMRRSGKSFARVESQYLVGSSSPSGHSISSHSSGRPWVSW